MRRLSMYGAGFALAAVLLSPLQANAFGFSFGGRVASIVPCVSGFGPSLYVTIIPAGFFSTQYIWTPATLTFLAGPPTHPGQQLLGVADMPFVCFIPAKVPIPLFGLRMQTLGTSAF